VKQRSAAARDAPGDKRLIAYLIPNPVESRRSELVLSCCELPDYMVPSGFITCLVSPHPNAKSIASVPPGLDKKSRGRNTPNRVRPTEDMAGIWSEFFAERVASTIIFELGADSLHVFQILRAQQSGIESNLADLQFDYCACSTNCPSQENLFGNSALAPSPSKYRLVRQPT